MAPKKKPVSPAKALPPSVPPPVARLVQDDAKTMETRLRLAAADRAQRPLLDRLEALLWTWPIRLDFSTRPPNPLWPSTVDGLETRQRKAAIRTRLTNLVETWYSDKVYPDPVYTSDEPCEGHDVQGRAFNWIPVAAPSTMHDTDFKNMLHDLCEELRKLSGVIVPDPDPRDDRRWILTLLESGWGDGRLSERCESQESVMNGLRKTQVRQRVCEIGEHARDAAYIAVRTNRCLHALQATKEHAQTFKDWLGNAKMHKPFVEEHLPAKFRAAFQMIERMPEAVDFYMDNAVEERSRQETAGRQLRPWVDEARRELKILDISVPHLNDLLRAWNLISFPH